MKLANLFKSKLKKKTPSTPTSSPSKSSPSKPICTSCPKSISETYPDSKVFGYPLPERLELIPKFVFDSIDYITRKGLKIEGLFRLSPSKQDLDVIIESIEANQNVSLNFSKYDVHLPSSLLKIYFRELADPLLTFDCYGMFIASERIPDETARLEMIKKVISFLPSQYYQVLKLLCEFLNKVTKESEFNKMTSDNLAIIFAPNILRDRGELDIMDLMRHSKYVIHLTKTIIDHTDYIFTPQELPTTSTETTSSTTTTTTSTTESSRTSLKANTLLLEQLGKIMQDQNHEDEQRMKSKRRQTLERRQQLSPTQRKKTLEMMKNHMQAVSQQEPEEEVDSPIVENKDPYAKFTEQPKEETIVKEPSPKPINSPEVKRKVTSPKVKSPKELLIEDIVKSVQKYLCSHNIFGVTVQVEHQTRGNTISLILSGLVLNDSVNCDLIEVVENLQGLNLHSRLDSRDFELLMQKIADLLGSDFTFNVSYNSLHEFDIMLDDCSAIVLTNCLHSMTKYFFENCDDEKLEDQYFVDWILSIFPTMSYYPYYDMVLFCLLVRNCYKTKNFDKLSLMLSVTHQEEDPAQKKKFYEDDKIMDYEKRALLISKLMGGKKPFFTEYNHQTEFTKHFGKIISEDLLKHSLSANPLSLFEDFTLSNDVGAVARVRTFENGEGVLFDAVRVPDFELIQFLVTDCEVNVNATNSNGISVLSLTRILYTGMIREEIEDFLTFANASCINPNNIDVITMDIWRMIMSFLDLKQLTSMCLISKSFYGLNIVDNEKLWMDIFKRIETVETVAFNPINQLCKVMDSRECRLSWRTIAQYKYEFSQEDITFFLFDQKDDRHKLIVETNTVLVTSSSTIESKDFISLLLFVFGECNLDDSMLYLYKKIKASKKSEKSMLAFIEENIKHHTSKLKQFVRSMQNVSLKKEMYKEQVQNVVYYSVRIDDYWFIIGWNQKHKLVAVIIVSSE